MRGMISFGGGTVPTQAKRRLEWATVSHSLLKVREGGWGNLATFYVELYQRRTRRARSVFQRLALPTSVSICNGIYSG